MPTHIIDKLSAHPHKRVNQIRFVLPFILFAIVAFYESWEHWIAEGRFEFDIHLFSEITFFGVLGPAAVFIVLTYTLQLLQKQVMISDRLDQMNQVLEQRVADRTGELQQRNAELAQANEELKQLDEMKSDFVSLVSHELRGPLTSLNGGLELALQTGEHLPPEAQRTLEVMARESERLTEFVNQILDVSRLEVGNLPLSMGPAAVLPMLRRAADLYCDCNHQNIRWNVPDDLPPIWGDEIYLERIVSNLLENAVKYSPVDQPIELIAHKDGSNLHITIRDHGLGIPLEKQAHVFERFHRLEKGDRVASQGWGLGLYFSRMFAEAQGGQVLLESPIWPNAEQPGAAFTLKMPITEDVPEDV